MAVETRYVVIRTNRNNEEQDVMTFTDKRAADDYDKMLDMADNMFELFEQSDLELTETQCEALGIFIAKQREEVLFALQAKKRPSTASTKNKKKEQQSDLIEESESKKSIKSLSETLMASNEHLDTTNTEVNNDSVPNDYVIEKDDAA